MIGRCTALVFLLAACSEQAAPAPAPAIPEEPAPAPLADAELYGRALALAPIVAERGCPRRLLGSAAHPFHEASVACDAFLTAALVSMAVAEVSRTEEVVRAIQPLIEHALSPEASAPFRSTAFSRVGERTLPRSILYRGFLLLMGAGLERLDPENPRLAFFDALADAVTAQLDASSSGFLPSFGDRRWPCDHAPAAAALRLRGAAADNDRWLAASDALSARLVRGLGAPRGFPTRVSRQGIALEAIPRGSVLAFTASFLAHASDGSDESPAVRFASVLERDFCRSQGELAACREWPVGHERAPDAVSGPIIDGFGIGASALGMGATRVLSDRGPHERLVRTAHAHGIEFFLAQPEQFPLENAIYLWARTIVSWSSCPAGDCA